MHCHFEDYDKSLVPGTYMNALIEVKSSDAYVLPLDAIVRFEDKQYIYKATGSNQFYMVEVSVGDTENAFTEIKIDSDSPLLNAAFVTKGAYSLLIRMKNTSEG